MRQQFCHTSVLVCLFVCFFFTLGDRIVALVGMGAVFESECD
jgi:hypothetical protein